MVKLKQQLISFSPIHTEAAQNQNSPKGEMKQKKQEPTLSCCKKDTVEV